MARVRFMMCIPNMTMMTMMMRDVNDNHGDDTKYDDDDNDDDDGR